MAKKPPRASNFENKLKEEKGSTTVFGDFVRQQAEKHQAEAIASKAIIEEGRAAMER